MGILGFGKKKKISHDLNKQDDSQTKEAIDLGNKAFTGGSIARDVTQDVAICMNSMGITKMPILKFFNSDQGIFDGTYMSHMNDPQCEMIKNAYGVPTYLSLLGCHALGVGAYVTLCQPKFKKPVDEWTIVEMQQVANDIHETDPYELALNTLGFAVDGNNKKCLDAIVNVGVQAYTNAANSRILDKSSLKEYMQVMYNAGITLVMRD